MRSVVFEVDPLDSTEAAQAARELRLRYGATAELFCEAVLEDRGCIGPKRREVQQVLRALRRIPVTRET